MLLSDDETAILLAFFDDDAAITKPLPPDLLNILASLRSSLGPSRRRTPSRHRIPSLDHSAFGNDTFARTPPSLSLDLSQVRSNSLARQVILTTRLARTVC